jgi:hypothetical protein
MDMDKDRCDICRFFKADTGTNDKGDCCRNPPRIYPASAAGFLGLYPFVLRGQWCGNFEEGAFRSRRKEEE